MCDPCPDKPMLGSSMLDKEGYLRDLSLWNAHVAVELARQDGIELTPAHWEILDVLCDFYRETGISPSMRPLVKLVRERVGEHAGSSLYLLRLFPGNPATLAAKIAGLPRPPHCL